MDKELIVSVDMVTYGHENYIKEAIEGILMQITTFEYDLIIADDCSPDGTEKIVRDIIETHPKGHLIKYFRHIQNLGMLPNGLFSLKQCKGKYIALCEGDDYWIDPYKLQKQVDFLEINPEYVLSFHNAKVLNVTNNELSLFVDQYKYSEYTADDIFDTWLIPTASMFFRNILGENFPDFVTKATHGDLAIQVYLNEFGKFYASNDVMSVYRINESSVTINSFSSLKHNNAHIEQLRLMNSFFKRKYNVQIKRRIYLYYLRNANLYRGESVVKPLFWILRAIALGPSITFYYKNKFINSIKILFYTIRVSLKLKKLC